MREVRSLIGMGSYYRRFIPNFSEIAEPVIALTRKYARFKWTDECQSTFEYLKQSLTVVPLLATLIQTSLILFIQMQVTTVLVHA